MNNFYVSSKPNLTFNLATPNTAIPEYNAAQMNVYSMQAMNNQYQQYQMQIAAQNYQAQQYQMQQLYQRQANSIPLGYNIYNPYADLVLDYIEPQFTMNNNMSGQLITNPNFQPPVYQSNIAYVGPK